jgi:hypothetical protein
MHTTQEPRTGRPSTANKQSLVSRYSTHCPTVGAVLVVHTDRDLEHRALWYAPYGKRPCPSRSYSPFGVPRALPTIRLIPVYPSLPPPLEQYCAGAGLVANNGSAG